MNAIAVIALNEVRRSVRHRWVIATTLLLAALSLSLAFLGSAPTGTVGADRLGITIVSLSSLTIFLVPLIALMLAFDAIVGDIENGTLFLLLTYPVGRGSVICGKFIGHAAVLGLATLLGYGAAWVAVGMLEGATDPRAWSAFARLMGSSVMLGAVFLAIGYLLSTLAVARGTAAGLAVAAWLFFVLLFDMGLLGWLVTDRGATLGAETVTALMMLNPTDVYRMLNLTASAGVSALSGMSALGADAALPPAGLALVLAAWVAAPLTAAMALFGRKEL